MNNKADKILIVGFGNLGKRYYESIIQLNNVEIYIYDPYLNDSNYPNVVKTLNLNFVIDLVIISTCADVRFDITKELINNNIIKNIVFEKFLFLEIEHYDIISKLLISKNINAWVNCTRRLYELYHYIKNKLDESHTDKSQIKMYVIGEDWQLCSNSVHFLDIYNYLSNIMYNKLMIKDVNIIDSSRSSFYDMYGHIYSSDDNFHLICTQKTTKNTLLISKISCNEYEFVLVNNNTTCSLIEFDKINKKYCTRTFPMPYLSHIAKDFVKDILQNKSIELSSYHTSMQIHLPLLKLFHTTFKNNNKETRFT